MENKLFEFKVGDKVKCAFFGDEVFELEDTPDDYYSICFKRLEAYHSFTVHGKSVSSHTHPVLTLVERPKRKEKRTITLYINTYPDGGEDAIHSSRKVADRYAVYNRIKCIEFTHEYEVEVEG